MSGGGHTPLWWPAGGRGEQTPSAHPNHPVSKRGVLVWYTGLMQTKPIPGTRLFAGEDGHIYTEDGRVRKARKALSGYLRLNLRYEGIQYTVTVHELVLNAWHGPRPPMRGTGRYVCRHLNGDKTDNRPSNLRWGTPAENNADTKLHNRTGSGMVV